MIGGPFIGYESGANRLLSRLAGESSHEGLRTLASSAGLRLMTQKVSRSLASCSSSPHRHNTRLARAFGGVDDAANIKAHELSSCRNRLTQLLLRNSYGSCV